MLTGRILISCILLQQLVIGDILLSPEEKLGNEQPTSYDDDDLGFHTIKEQGSSCPCREKVNKDIIKALRRCSLLIDETEDGGQCGKKMAVAELIPLVQSQSKSCICRSDITPVLESALKCCSDALDKVMRRCRQGNGAKEMETGIAGEVDTESVMGDDIDPMEGNNDPMEGDYPMEGNNDSKEGDSDPKEGDSDPMEGNNDSKEGDSDPMEGNNDSKEGDSDPMEGNNDSKEGDSDPMEGNNDSKEGDSDPMEGNNDSKEDSKKGPETEVVYTMEGDVEAMGEPVYSIKEENMTIIRETKLKSCTEIKQKYPKSPSGYYTIYTHPHHPYKVYCEMSAAMCGGGAWTRVDYFDVKKRGCPHGFVRYSAKKGNIVACGKSAISQDCDMYNLVRRVHLTSTCRVIPIPLNPAWVPYTQICGKVVAYQFGKTKGMYRKHYSGYPAGITFTRHNQRIFSYIAGYSEKSTDYDGCNKFCGKSLKNELKNHFYCESGSPDVPGSEFFYKDQLWDGKQCRHRESACCYSSHGVKMPWFKRTFKSPTTSIFYMHVCSDYRQHSNVLFSQYEFYVK